MGSTTIRWAELAEGETSITTANDGRFGAHLDSAEVEFIVIDENGGLNIMTVRRERGR